MARFAEAKEPFLAAFSSWEGHSNHDTFSRLFRLLDPAQFGAAFQRFITQVSSRFRAL